MEAHTWTYQKHNAFTCMALMVLMSFSERRHRSRHHDEFQKNKNMKTRLNISLFSVCVDFKQSEYTAMCNKRRKVKITARLLTR